MLTLYTSSYLLLIPALTLHMEGHRLSSLAFPCTPVEGQNRLVQPSKRFKKTNKPKSNTAELAKSRMTENTNLKISLLLSLFLRDTALGFCGDNYVCKTHYMKS